MTWTNVYVITSYSIHYTKLYDPVDIASIIISERLTDAGIKKEEIGTFYITPCAAKIAAVKSPVEDSESAITGVINMDFLYNKVLHMLSNSDRIVEPINHSLSGRDVIWSLSGRNNFV